MTTKFDIIKLKLLAALGNVEAMYTLGGNYLYGIGVEVNLERAHSYFEKSVCFLNSSSIVNSHSK